MKKFFGEFKKFITRGNVVDMAVGVIVGGAFTAIVNGMSNFILKPLINALLAFLIGEGALNSLITPLSEKVYLEGTNVYDLSKMIYIDWGSFINAVINFFLIAFVLFTIVRTMNHIAEANKNMQEQIHSEATKAIKKIRKENKISWKEAKAIYEARVAEAKAKAEEEARIAEEEAKAKAEEEARIAEEKAMANTVLLTEIRNLMKKSLGIEDEPAEEETQEEQSAETQEEQSAETQTEETDAPAQE